jgi:hypothetical protein
MATGAFADQRPPTPRQRAWAKETLRAALRSDRIDLGEFEDRFDRVLHATTYADLHAAIADLPHPPAPIAFDAD